MKERVYLDVDTRVPLDSFDLELCFESKSRVLGVFGPSGAGKTTFLETLCGLRKRSLGKIACQGQVWQDTRQGCFVRTESRGIGYVPQDLLLFPHMRVRKNLLAGSKRAENGAVALHQLFEEVVSTLELEPLLDRLPNELSGGEKQRVSLGRALCSGPELLLLDEPLAALDMKLRHKILPFLVRVKERFDLPIVVVSHNPTELMALCDEVIALKKGAMVARGTPVEVFSSPEVYSAAAAEGFENVLSGSIVEHKQHATRIRLMDASEQTIRVPRVDLPIGSKVSMGIGANEILVANRKIEGLSARNGLIGEVVRLERVEHRYVLAVRLEGRESIVAELTPDAVVELGLSKGDYVWLAFKTSAVNLYL